MTQASLGSDKKKIYFSNLDGLRALAVFLVVSWHIEIHKVRFGFKQLYFNDLGFMGVSIFFILSGFLITYILLAEKEINNQINFKAFYMRRILRIWPLYFFALLFGFFIYPGGMKIGTLAMCLFLMPNIPFMMQLIHPFVQPIWSIGVEEQFYLFQPQFFRIKNKKLMFICIVAAMLFLIIIKEVGFRFPNTVFADIANYLYYFRVELLLAGSVGAILLFNYKSNPLKKAPLTKAVLNKYTQAIAWLYFIGHIFTPTLLKDFFAINMLFSISVFIIILNLSAFETSIIQLDNRFIRYIGKVSYGIYLLHNIALISILYFMKKYFSNADPILVNIIIYALTFPLATLIAGLSYKYFESYFLRLKVKYSTVIRSNDPNNQ